MRHFFIINPHSFRKSPDGLKRLRKDIDDCFSGTQKADYKIYMSRYPRDAVAVIHRHMTEEARGEPVRIYAVGGGGALAVAGSISGYTKGRFEKNKTFFRKQFKKMNVKSETPIRVHLDGETFYADEVNLEIVPGRIRFFAPEGMEFEDYSYRAYKSARKERNGGVL